MQKTSTVKNIKNGRNVVSIEKKSIDDLHKRFSSKNFSGKFSEAVELIYRCKGKVVVTDNVIEITGVNSTEQLKDLESNI